MPDYSKGKIYKITDITQEKCYIGSSVQRLSKRMVKHRMDYKNYLDNKAHYCSVYDLFDEFGVENCKIFLLENYPCNSKEELHSKEGEYQKKTDCVNKNVAGRSNKERYEDKKDIILEKQRIYSKNNKEKISERRKTEYQNNRDERLEKAKEYREREGNSEKHKEYCKKRYENMKEELNEKQRQYRKDNPEKVREQERQAYQRNKAVKQRPWTCECGLTICFSAKSYHLKTKRHIQIMANKNQTNPQE